MKQEYREQLKRMKAERVKRERSFKKALANITRLKWSSDEIYKEDNWSGKCGDWVRVRPCAEEYRNKTYLGVFIGTIALGQGASIKKRSKTLTIKRNTYNPMIFIPDLNKVVFGCGSWWSKVEDPSVLKDITDETIDNVWYVKAMKSLDSKDAVAQEANE